MFLRGFERGVGLGLRGRLLLGVLALSLLTCGAGVFLRGGRVLAQLRRTWWRRLLTRLAPLRTTAESMVVLTLARL